MKSLKDYILEHREYFNPEISVEVLKRMFEQIAQDGETSWQDLALIKNIYPDDKDKIEPHTIDGILGAYYYSSKGMNGKLTDAGVKKFLNLLKKQPLDRICRFLGAGSEGIVYDLGNGKVLKVFFDLQPFEVDFKKTIAAYHKMIGHKYKTLPTIYKVNDHYLVRERINRSDDDLTEIREFFKLTQEKVMLNTSSFMDLEKIVVNRLENQVSKQNLTPEQLGVLNWLVACRNELSSLGYNNLINLGDFQPGNIGKTDDGRIVYFDW